MKKGGREPSPPSSANQAMALLFGLEVILDRNRVSLIVEAVKLVGITSPLFRRPLGMDLNMQVRAELCSAATANTAHKPNTVTNRNLGALRRESALHMHEEEQIPSGSFFNGNCSVVAGSRINNFTSNRSENRSAFTRRQVNAAVELTLVGSGAGAGKNGSVHIVVLGSNGPRGTKALAVKIVDAGSHLCGERAVGKTRPDGEVVSDVVRNAGDLDKLLGKPDGVVPIRRTGPLHIAALLGKVIPIHLNVAVIAEIIFAYRVKGDDLVGGIARGVDIGVIGIAAASEAIQAFGGIAFRIEAAIGTIPPNLVGRTIFGINIDIGTASRIVVQILARGLVRKTVIPAHSDRPFHACCHDKISFLILCLIQCPINH